MNRSIAVLLVGLLTACRAAGPKPPPAAPAAPADVLGSYVGELRLLRHRGDQRSLTLKPGQRITGECDVAVRVSSAAFDKRTARFSLETIGLPKQGDREARCKRVQPGIRLALTGFGAAPAASEVAARVAEVLQTPDAYLRSKGVAFDLPPGEPPAEVASEAVDGTSQERELARRVTAWPRPLLSVNPYLHDPSRRVRHEGLVEFEAVVGTDGRLYRPRLKTALDERQERAVVTALSFWRFEPARRGGDPVGARVPLRLVLRIR